MATPSIPSFLTPSLPTLGAPTPQAEPLRRGLSSLEVASVFATEPATPSAALLRAELSQGPNREILRTVDESLNTARRLREEAQADRAKQEAQEERLKAAAARRDRDAEQIEAGDARQLIERLAAQADREARAIAENQAVRDQLIADLRAGKPLDISV
jgi:hypothetical protein